MNEEMKNPQAWIKEEIVTSDFLGDFQSEPAVTLQSRGFHLHDSYEELLDGLEPREKEAVAKIFVRIADADPQDLHGIYADWVDHYEHFFGWQGLQDEGPRGWCP